MLKWMAQNFLVQGFSLAASFLDRIFVVGLLIRSFGVDQYADWITLTSCAGLLGLAEVGLNLYYGNSLQRAFARQDEAAFKRVVRVSMFWSVALGLVLFSTAALFLLNFDIARLVALRALSGLGASSCAMLLASAVISKIMRGCISQIYRGRQEFARGILIDAICTVAVPTASVIVVLCGGSPKTLAAAYLLCDLTAGWVVMAGDIKRRYPFLSLRPALPTAAETANLISCVQWQAVQGANTFLSLFLPPLILGAAGASARDVVAFVTGRTLVNLGRQIITMLLIAAGVEIAPRLHAGEKASIAVYSSQLGVVGATLISGGSIAMFCYGGAFVALWTGRAELFDETVYCWLLLGAFSNTIAAPFQMLMGFINEPRVAAVAGVANLALGLPLAALASLRFGVGGLTFGLAFGEIAACLLAIGKLLPETVGGDPFRYFAHCLAAAALTGLWCLAVAKGVEGLSPQTGSVWLAVHFVGFVALGVAPTLLLAAPEQLRKRAFASAYARVATARMRQL